MNNNTNDDHGCYVVRLSRIFALPRAAAILILCLAVIYVATIILSLVTDLIPEGTPHLGFVLGIALLISYLKTFPRLMEVTPGSLKVESHVGFYYLLTRRRVFGTLSDYDRQMTVYNITSIQYLQTPLERFFNVGRVYAEGDILMIQGDYRNVYEGSLTVCGVKDFDNTSAWMKDFMKLTDEC
jgi:hypothetical protein